jgi:hypothetical protein
MTTIYLMIIIEGNSTIADNLPSIMDGITK